MQVELKNIHYKSRKNFELKDISFNIEQGFITGLMGKNGAGKTTIFQMLMNQNSKYTGEILIDGTDIKNPKADRGKIGLISEEQKFIGNKSMLDNAVLCGLLCDEFSIDTFKSLMNEMKLSYAKHVESSSRGEKMKFQLALALSRNLELLLIDEATAGMDPVFRKDFFKILHQYMEDEKHSILISTHNEEEVKRHMDYVVELKEGRAYVRNGILKDM